MKDAAAASIWGVRSGNGVIVLTSKKGKLNEPLNIDFSANLTIGNKPNAFYSPDFLNASDYINYEQTLFNRGYYDNLINNPARPPVSPLVQILADQRSGLITADQANTQIGILRNIDVRNDIEKYLYQYSIDQQYNLSMRGGSNKTTYFFSAGYDNNLSNLVGNQNDRLSISSQNTFNIVKNLQLSLGLSYVEAHATNDAISNLNDGGSSSTIYPYTQLAAPDGTALPIVKDYNLSWITNQAPLSGLLNWQYIPLNEIRNADNSTLSKDIRINTGAKYFFLKDFNAALSYQYETSNINTNNYYNQNTYYTRNLINLYTKTDGTYNIPLGGILQQSESDLAAQHLRGLLNFRHNWDNFGDLTALAGTELSQNVLNSNSATTYGYDKNLETSQNVDFKSYFPYYLPIGAALIPNNLGFAKTTDNYLSYFGNAAFTISNKYVISASARIDKSNLFGVNTNQKGVPLYSIGALWNISKEPFYKIAYLPNLKLRITAGYNGNIDKNVAALTTIRQFSYDPLSGGSYAAVSNPGNPELRWEKDRRINFGLDFGMKNLIITGSIDYYLKAGIDLFAYSPLPPSTGLISFLGNTANTKGSGLDLVLNSKNISTLKFNWGSNFQLSYVLDKVTRYNLNPLTQDAFVYGSGNSGTILPILNEPLFEIYSYKWAGLNHNTGNPQGYQNGQPSTDYAGIIANTKLADLVANGPSRPTTFGSLRNTFSYGNISLSFNIIYKLNYAFKKTSINYQAIAQDGFTNSDFSRRWQKPGDELSTNVPSIAYPPYDSNEELFYKNAAVLIDNANNIRLQDLSLSYEIKKNSRSKMPFNSMQLYAYANNLGILWRANHDHLDPDLFATPGILPIPRTISFGVKTNF